MKPIMLIHISYLFITLIKSYILGFGKKLKNGNLGVDGNNNVVVTNDPNNLLSIEEKQFGSHVLFFIPKIQKYFTLDKNIIKLDRKRNNHHNQKFRISENKNNQFKIKIGRFSCLDLEDGKLKSKICVPFTKFKFTKFKDRPLNKEIDKEKNLLKNDYMETGKNRANNQYDSKMDDERQSRQNIEKGMNNFKNRIDQYDMVPIERIDNNLDLKNSSYDSHSFHPTPKRHHHHNKHHHNHHLGHLPKGFNLKSMNFSFVDMYLNPKIRGGKHHQTSKYSSSRNKANLGTPKKRGNGKKKYVYGRGDYNKDEYNRDGYDRDGYGRDGYNNNKDDNFTEDEMNTLKDILDGYLKRDINYKDIENLNDRLKNGLTKLANDELDEEKHFNKGKGFKDGNGLRDKNCKIIENKNGDVTEMSKAELEKQKQLFFKLYENGVPMEEIEASVDPAIIVSIMLDKDMKNKISDYKDCFVNGYNICNKYSQNIDKSQYKMLLDDIKYNPVEKLQRVADLDQKSNSLTN